MNQLESFLWPEYIGDPVLRDLWEEARRRTEEEHLPGAIQYIPLAAIIIDEEISPREELDLDLVEVYAENISSLPPIDVQAKTFVLIDGRHRFEAHASAGRLFIKAVQSVVSDDELMERAVYLNILHGKNLSQKEKYARGKLLYEKHRGEPGWTKARLAKVCGVTTRTVTNWLQQFKNPVPATTDPGKEPRAKKSWIEMCEDMTSKTPGERALTVTDEFSARLMKMRAISMRDWFDEYIQKLEERFPS